MNALHWLIRKFLLMIDPEIAHSLTIWVLKDPEDMEEVKNGARRYVHGLYNRGAISSDTLVNLLNVMEL